MEDGWDGVGKLGTVGTVGDGGGRLGRARVMSHDTIMIGSGCMI